MNKYEDERLEQVMNGMQAKLFRFLFMVFAITFLYKLYLLDGYQNPIRSLDYFILYSTILYAGYLQYKSRADFYQKEKNSLVKFLLKASFVGILVTIQPLRINNFAISQELLITYFITFMSGFTLFTIVFLISNFIKVKRHQRFEKQLDQEE